MKFSKTLLAACGLALSTTAWAGGGTASIQIIHNCADTAASTVDVWVNGSLFVDNLDFRTATPFVSAPAGVPLTIGIAPANSTSSTDAIYEQTLTLTAGDTYIVVASGIISATGYSPETPFSLNAFDMAEESAAGGSANTDVLVYHGSTDAPPVDIYESEVLHATAVNNLSYGEFAGYLALPTADYTVQVRDSVNSTILAAYSAPLSTLGLGGAALTVLASGFLNPAANSNGPAFGLYAALAAGGPLVALPSAAIPTARVQVVHNSADLAAASVDVWLNNTLLLNDFAFRTASPFVDVQAGVPFVVSIAAPNSTDTVGAIAHYTFNLDAGGHYILVANGIVSSTGYSPDQPFNLYVIPDAREVANDPMQTDVVVFHGATDAPAVNVAETAVLGGAVLVNDLSYGESSGYLEVPTADYSLQVQTADGTPVADFPAPLATLGLTGQAITVFASGFLNPSNNSNGPAFGLWVALASGGPLVELTNSTGIASQRKVADQLMLYPNPASTSTTLELRGVTSKRMDVKVADISGRVVMDMGSMEMAPTENTVKLNVSGLASGSYRLILNTTQASTTLPLHIVR